MLADGRRQGGTLPVSAAVLPRRMSPRRFLEEVFCRRDPLSSSVRPLCVGGKCSQCERVVCAGKCAASVS